MKKVMVYDLDGTLSKLNNTYDFIDRYYEWKGRRLRRQLNRMAKYAIGKLFFLNKSYRRALKLRLLFGGIAKQELTDFYEQSYKDTFLSTLTPLGDEVLKKTDEEGIMLTGCVDLPANNIAELFGFKTVYATVFSYDSQNRIAGISRDTLANLKAECFEREPDTHYTYYTDDLASEYKLKEIMDDIILYDDYAQECT